MPSALPEQIEQFLGSSQVFALAVSDVLEETLLREVGQPQASSATVRVLKLVGEARAQTISDIAVLQGVSNAAASKSIDRIVRMGLLRRTEGESDRRAAELTLTPEGQRILAAYEAARQRALQAIFTEFSACDLQSAAELLDRIASLIVSHTPRPEEICLKCRIYRRGKCLARDPLRSTCYYRRRRQRQEAAQVRLET